MAEAIRDGLRLEAIAADIAGDGDRLGPVGGRIVADVLIGIVQADPESFLAVDPVWTPTLGKGIGELLEAVSRPGHPTPLL
jgi:hypothetical protein